MHTADFLSYTEERLYQMVRPASLNAQFVKWMVFALVSLGHLHCTAETNGWSFMDAENSGTDYRYTDTSPAVDCRELISITDFDHSVISARLVPSTPTAPESCEVTGVIAPEIQYRINLPTNWNRRLYIHGNGGYGGHSVYGNYGLTDRRRALSNGFVTAFSNLGHDKEAEPGGTWAYNAIHKEIDYSYRALHLTTVVSKRLAEMYYGQPVSYSYYDGCSTAGGQGIKAALRYPADYDGILVGSPVFDFVRSVLYAWNNQMAQLQGRFDEDRIELLGNIIMTRYDKLDEVADGVIENPLTVDFDPGRDLPVDASGKTGFTATEITALEKIYNGLVIDGIQIAPGIPVGSEPKGHDYKFATFESLPDRSAWRRRVFPDERGFSEQIAIVDSWLKYLAFEKDDETVDWRKLDIKETLPRLKAMSKIMDANSTDFSSFRDRGGKLLAYHGWADVGVNPHITVNYYTDVVDYMGKDTASFFRLFLVPGGFHCWGGLGADRFDAMTALINWVERGTAPEMIKAIELKDGKTVREHPLCPYPEIAGYRGRGDTTKIESYTCEVP